MKLLLDTHILIWFLENNQQLKGSIKEEIEKPENDVYVSVASFWEIAIKLQLGKLKLNNSLSDIITEVQNLAIEIVPIEPFHTITLLQLPLHHRDPFDRIIIAQAVANNLTVVTADAILIYTNLRE